jgi:hypothetical protein
MAVKPGTLLPLGLLVICLCCCENRPPASQTTSALPFTSCHEIPGVMPEELQAIKQLQTRRSHFVYAMNYFPETFWNDDGTIGGYIMLLCRWLSTLFGIEFRVAGLQSYEAFPN